MEAKIPRGLPPSPSSNIMIILGRSETFLNVMRFFSSFFWFFAYVFPSQALGQEREIFVMRHVQKQCDDCSSCGITSQGVELAERIAEKLKDKQITLVFHTDCKRSKDTVEALGHRLFIGEKATPDCRPVLDSAATTEPSGAALGRRTCETNKKQSVDLLIKEIKKHRCDQAILVVDHSDRILEIVTALGWTKDRPSSIEDYGKVFSLKATDPVQDRKINFCFDWPGSGSVNFSVFLDFSKTLKW